MLLQYHKENDYCSRRGQTGMKLEAIFYDKLTPTTQMEHNISTLLQVGHLLPDT